MPVSALSLHQYHIHSIKQTFISSIFSENSLQSPQTTMLFTKRFIEMARKWQRLAALRRRRITNVNTSSGAVADQCSNSSVASKGHVFVYTDDGKRFMIPLAYLSNNVFVELLRMAEEEFGLPSNGPITLPCDAACMESIISTLKNRVLKDRWTRETANANSWCRVSSSLLPGHKQQQLVLYGF